MTLFIFGSSVSKAQWFLLGAEEGMEFALERMCQGQLGQARKEKQRKLAYKERLGAEGD